MKNVFEFSSYRTFFQAYFSSQKGQHGLKSKFAQFIQCQGSFVSQVLSGKADLSLDQAYRATLFLNLRKDEAEYFQLLVQHERAGDKDYRQHLKEKIARFQEKQTHLESRTSPDKTLSLDTQAEYYSSWLYSAVHILSSISTMNTVESMSLRLGLPVAVINQVLEFLISNGLIQLNKGKISMGPTHIHLPADSVLIKTHHSNWRQKAIQSLDQRKKSDLHYSVVYSLSKEDVEVIKLRIAELIEANIKIVKASGEEVLYANTIDFFEV